MKALRAEIELCSHCRALRSGRVDRASGNYPNPSDNPLRPLQGWLSFSGDQSFPESSVSTVLERNGPHKAFQSSKESGIFASAGLPVTAAGAGLREMPGRTSRPHQVQEKRSPFQDEGHIEVIPAESK